MTAAEIIAINQYRGDARSKRLAERLAETDRLATSEGARTNQPTFKWDPFLTHAEAPRTMTDGLDPERQQLVRDHYRVCRSISRLRAECDKLSYERQQLDEEYDDMSPIERQIYDVLHECGRESAVVIFEAMRDENGYFLTPGWRDGDFTPAGRGN